MGVFIVFYQIFAVIKDLRLAHYSLTILKLQFYRDKVGNL